MSFLQLTRSSKQQPGVHSSEAGKVFLVNVNHVSRIIPTDDGCDLIIPEGHPEGPRRISVARPYGLLLNDLAEMMEYKHK